MDKVYGRSMIWLTLIVCLFLTIIPLPLAIDPFRPEWLLVCLVYWAIALPHRVSVGVAFLFGLVLDLLLGSTLGVRALAMAIVVFVAASNGTLLRNFSVWQQAIVVGALVTLSKFVVYWAEYLVHSVEIQEGYFYPIVPSVVAWPWIFMLLRKARRHWKVT